MNKKHYIIIGSILATAGIAVAWLGSNAQKIPFLKHADPFVLQAIVLVLGIVAAAAMTWIATRGDHKPAEGAGGGGGSAEAPAEVTDMSELLGEAEARLAVAQQEKDSKLGKLPAIILLGETGSAKTTTMVQSGAEAESLAGQVYEENNILPTPAANFWFAHHTVFVEMGGKLLADNNAWKTLIGGLQPSKAAALLGTAEEVPRAALVCVDAESLQSASPDPLAALARKLRTQLAEISRLLGINLPVYVLFTRSDRFLFFTEYFSKLNNEEATRILGTTLPIVQERTGIYAEQETVRLGAAFENLFRQLCNARPTFLSRETDPMQLAAMYEFPREFRKVHQGLVRFLVELCRPSQLTVGPFMRGFYFSGVRPVMVNEVAPAAPLAPTPAAGGRMGATGMFRAQAAAAAAGAQRIVGQRKVPQWLFLSHFFNDLLLADAAAKGASSSSIRASMPRRILLTAAAVLCLIYSSLLLVSFGKNRALATNVKLASAGIASAAAPAAGEAASLDSLQKLENLRQSLETLTKYNRHGAPLSYKWGLYIGNDLYPDVKKLYFADFHRLLLAPTQDTMVAQLHGLPSGPGPTDDYTPPYNTLKAYLETTSNHEKATHDYLPPVLLNRWSASRNVDPDRIALAQKQFDFYTDELQLANPYSSDNDAASIGNARHYLGQFGGLQRVYQAMLADAAKTGQALNFNKRFPGSAEEVIDNYTVQPAFTKPGWDFMKAALKNPGKYFEGEAWVLGPQSTTDIDRTKLAQQLQSMYYGDYMKEWRNYIKEARVVPYAGIPDASKKLGVTSGNQSPLLELFWLASVNTQVDAPDVANAFQPVQAVVPASPVEKFFAPPNQAYMNTLVTLQGSLDAIGSPPNDAAKNTTLSNATAAHGAAKQVSLTFNPDTSDAHIDSRVLGLMNDPITYVENLLRSLGPATLNAAGRNFCAEYRAMFSKFPFNRTSKTDATVDDVNGIFKTPDGKFWKFYNDNLTKLLPKQGSDYMSATADGVTLTPGFVAFFKKAAAFGNSLYAGNTPDPHFSYNLKSVKSDGIEGAVLSLDGQQVSYSGDNMVSKTLNWQSTGTHGVKATYKRGGDNDWDNEEGLWAIFKFFYTADRTVPAGGGYTLEWVMRSGKDAKPVTIEGGKELTVRFQADVPMFQKDFFASMACVAEVAKQ